MNPEEFELDPIEVPTGLAERLRAILQESTPVEIEGYIVIFLSREGWKPGLLGMLEVDGRWLGFRPDSMLKIMKEIVES